MLDSLIRFFIIYSRPKIIISGFLLIIMVNLVLFPYFASLMGNHFTIESILDLQFGFENSYVQRLLNYLGKKGRNAYLYSTLFVDIPYLIIYGFTYAFLIAYFAKKKRKDSSYWNYLILLPLLISFFDLLENIGIVYLLKHPFSYQEKWIPFISLANQMKWIFAGLTLSGFLLLLLYKKPKKSSLFLFFI
jgi:hypothetical protein